jgi:hypothetical protein
MRIAIVTTTINTPEVLSRFCRSARSGGLDWRLYVVGDRKTPDLESFVRELGPHAVWIPHTEHDRWRTSAVLRWDCIQRRSIGFLAAAADGPWDFYLSVDDDNEPDEEYFETFARIASEPVRRRIRPEHEWFNYFQGAEVSPPIVPFPRGFPLSKRTQATWQVEPADVACEQVWAYQGLSYGDPDVDALTHIVAGPRVQRFEALSAVACGAWSPINSQNTFVRGRCLPLYLMFDQVGRFDDVIAGFLLQHYIYENDAFVHFGVPFTRQERGLRDFLHDFEREVEGILSIDAILAHIRSVNVKGMSAADAMLATFAPRENQPAFFVRHRPLVEAWLADLAGASP